MSKTKKKWKKEAQFKNKKERSTIETLFRRFFCHKNEIFIFIFPLAASTIKMKLVTIVHVCVCANVLFFFFFFVSSYFAPSSFLCAVVSGDVIPFCFFRFPIITRSFAFYLFCNFI